MSFETPNFLEEIPVTLARDFSGTFNRRKITFKKGEDAKIRFMERWELSCCMCRLTGAGYPTEHPQPGVDFNFK